VDRHVEIMQQWHWPGYAASDLARVIHDDGTVAATDLPPYVPSAEAWVRALSRVPYNEADAPHMVTILARFPGLESGVVGKWLQQWSLLSETTKEEDAVKALQELARLGWEVLLPLLRQAIDKDITAALKSPTGP
jgi:hypothetical protein